MAQKVNIVLVDDIDGSEAVETVSFAVDGMSYEIDVNDKHAKKLRDALATYVEHGRKVGGRRTRGTATKGTSDTKKIKEWATAQGLEFPQRGRLPQSLVDQYTAANG